MTFNGWLQIAIYCRPGDPDHQAVRRLHDARLRRASARLLSPVLRPGRARHLPAVRRRRARGAALGRPTRSRCCCSASPASSSLYALQRLQSVLPFNPQGSGAVDAGPRLQHRGQLRHQHQLAVLRARDDDELPRRRWPG